MGPKRRELLAKYIAALSQILVGAGVFARIYSPEVINWFALGLSIAGAVVMILLALAIQPGE